MKQLRKEAAQRQRRIIWNNDGADVCEGHTPEKFLAAGFQQVANTQIDSVFYCTGVTTQFSHLTRVGEVTGDFFPEDLSDAYALSRRDGIRGLREAGYDTLQLATEFCHDNDSEIFFSLRMNDIHDSIPKYDWMVSRWKREHPEYCLGEAEDWHRQDYHSPRRWWSALDFEIPEVREYLFRILEDVCQRYDVDGIELDWWRSPLFFRPTLDVHPVGPQHIAIMNDFVRRVRVMTERVAQQRGRPLLVACRVPLSVERSLAIGLDVVTWLRDDLCDMLILGGGYVPLAMAPQVREMVEFGHQFDVPVYACISASLMSGQYASAEAWRGAAMNAWQAGADGIYTFNFFPGQPAERLSQQMGSSETLKGLDKIYGIDYMVVDKFEGDLVPGMVAPDRLPITLVAGGTVTAKFPVGEDIVANTPEGRSPHPHLQFHISGLVGGDQISVKLNGEELGTPAPAEHLSGQSPVIWGGFPRETDPQTAVWFALQPDPNLVRVGENLVELRLTSERAPAEGPAVLDHLQLLVRYQ